MTSSCAVLFVCLGNICRSPLAEAAFRQEAKKRGWDIKIDSAGLGGWHVGDPPDVRAIREAKKQNIDITHYRGRKVSTQDFTQFTHIVAMDNENLSRLRALSPQNSTAHIALLMDYVPNKAGQEIADPYYGNEKDFDRTWEQVHEGAIALADHLEKQS